MILQELVRKNIWDLKPYSCARNEFKGDAHVWLDANENPFNAPYNRYPDPLQRNVKAKIGKLRNISPENVFLGVGSDECIDIVYRVFCNPGIDNVVAISPTYGMYEVCANINDVEYRRVPLTATFDIDSKALLAATDTHTKVIWICSPNNPTGNAFNLDEIENLCLAFKGIIVIDEAYIDFSTRGTMLDKISQLPQVIVLQTLSKAWGSAAARLGIAFAHKDIINIFNKVKYPYNINLLTQNYASDVLDKYSEVQKWVNMLLAEREVLAEELKAIKIVKEIYPTDANFILVKVDDADSLYTYLCDTGIIIRNRTRVEKCAGCVRITVGNHDENLELLNALKTYGDK